MNIPDKWLTTLTEPELRVYMVDPHKLDTVRGELLTTTGGPCITDLSLTDGYYSNTRISGSLTTIDDNYIGGSWLRIKVDGEDVATLGVQNQSNEMAPENSEKRTYNLQSVLWMLDEDAAYTLFTIAAKTKASTVLKAVAKTCGKEIVLQPGFHDGWFNSPVAYERTDSYRSILSDISTSTGNQLTVDGHGRLSVEPYVAPASKTVSYTLDLDDGPFIVLDPGYSDQDETGEAYNRTVVISTKQENDKDRTIVAHSDAPASSPISASYRGWTRTQVHQVSDMSPFTQARANQLVNQYIYDDRSRGRTRDCTCLYWPVKGGEVIKWVQNGKSQKYLVQTADYDLVKWTVKLTLKEVE